MLVQSFLCAVNWGVVGWVLVGTVVLIVVVAAIGRAIAVAFPPNPEHVSSFRRAKAAPTAPVPAVPAPAPVAVPAAPAVAPASSSDISPEVLAVISAAVAIALHGHRYVIKDVAAVAQKAPDIEQLMSLWSLEGRRQVYSSHTTR